MCAIQFEPIYKKTKCALFSIEPTEVKNKVDVIQYQSIQVISIKPIEVKNKARALQYRSYQSEKKKCALFCFEPIKLKTEVCAIQYRI